MKKGAVALVLLAVVASGCEPTINREVLFVGDSVTVQSTQQIVESFNHVPDGAEPGRYAPVFGSTVVGQGLAQVPGVAEDKLDEFWAAHVTSLMSRVDPEVIVVELGYNDCGNLTGYGWRIDQFMARIPRSVPVHWLTMADPEDRSTCDTIINTELLAATVRHSNLSLLGFAAHMNPHPEWFTDGVHLNGEGQAEYALWLRNQLDAIYPDDGD